MNKLKLFLNKITETLDNVKLSKVFIALLVGLLVGWFLSLIKLDNLFLVFAAIAVCIDLVYSAIKDDKNLTDKVISCIIILLIARGIPSVDPNYAAIFGMLYFRLEDIIITFKSLFEKKK
jgi:predicted branched-subunit amino acid permease